MNLEEECMTLCSIQKPNQGPSHQGIENKKYNKVTRRTCHVTSDSEIHMTIPFLSETYHRVGHRLSITGCGGKPSSVGLVTFD